VASEVERIKKERSEKDQAEAGDASSAKKNIVSPLQEVLGNHHKSLAKWTIDGFFHLPLELGLELLDHDFKWGATFEPPTAVDLHHFELNQKSRAVPATIPSRAK